MRYLPNCREPVPWGLPQVCSLSDRIIEPTSRHAFFVHFIENFFYFVQCLQFAAPEPARRELLAESRKHAITAQLRQIP
jgi:hypothetical protein